MTSEEQTTLQEWLNELKDVKNRYPEEYDQMIETSKAVLERLKGGDFKPQNYAGISKRNKLRIAQMLLKSSQNDQSEFNTALNKGGRAVGKIFSGMFAGIVDNVKTYFS